MRVGICASLKHSAAIKTAGGDFVEENVQTLFQGSLPDAQYDGRTRIAESSLPVAAANCLVPGALKITGPDADPARLRAYMSQVLRRAGEAGTRILVFGSGGARQVPDGFDRDTARSQIVDFARLSAPIAEQYGVTLVAEPLCRKECNIINSVAEAMTYVNAVDHPNFQCLVDSYHFWTDDEPLANLPPAAAWIKHVHLADKDGRVAPGQSGTSDYRPFFRVLKRAGYDGMLSVEAMGFGDFANTAPGVLAFIRKQWQEA